MKTNRRKDRTGLAAYLVAATLSTIGLGTAVAHETEPKFTLNAIKDAAYGRMVTTGRFDEAIDKITTSKTRSSERIYAPTNLCVAYVLTRDLDNAAGACDTAIDKFEQRLAAISEYQSPRSTEVRAYRRFVAVAYSNRGVLHAIKGEAELARTDFEKARQMDTRIPAPHVNLARLAIKESMPAA